ncbi:fumarylacetoacetate hydrolase family protein [Oharaeibacter diazotrophicus]|uniref:Fumarylpyruvate hydrolase n=1 Tax=Oharaeibacter diazotrophicus TaxID=1920512 RepID=A0A4R6RKI3_9HYPH|nr:fumarylacetoacetate hydrolase family protein [Oharaeibacter diazotrophicus]TDP86984.1 fumarylpyruvate hydrolase [Oharaeibacter diazotrophicus]BBE71073.1 fumarylpyruvate hydrolase [Pleomorphomonas sp. SM30]GLS77824.1 fumarylacetoacetate hydrolase [Oharaeibacter diazotrophicus]
MAFAVPAPAVAVVPVAGGDLFPVRRVHCVGRNYAEHAREMGGDPTRDAPFFFSKPADALVTHGAPVPYPPATSDFHFEMELVVAIGTGGADIAVADALNHVFGYAAGLDMTRRDLQAAAKKAGRPWDMAKGFDKSAPIGEIAPKIAIGHPDRGAIALTVNGVTRQAADLADMIWSVPEIVAHLSGLVRLEPGDLIFTGTPAGVGAVTRGDVLAGRIEGVGTVETTIV